MTAMKCEKCIYENKYNYEREMSKKAFLKTVTAANLILEKLKNVTTV